MKKGLLKLYIKGESKGLSKKEACSAIRFFADKLISNKVSRQIKIKVEFAKLVGNSPGGECDWTDENINPSEFIIVINNRFGKRKTLLYLAHEMTHIKQFVMGEMVDMVAAKYKGQYTKWRGKLYSTQKTDYWDEPWEIEAYGREIGLYERYRTHLKIQKDYKKFCRNNK